MLTGGDGGGPSKEGRLPWALRPGGTARLPGHPGRAGRTRRRAAALSPARHPPRQRLLRGWVHARSPAHAGPQSRACVGQGGCWGAFCGAAQLESVDHSCLLRQGWASSPIRETLAELMLPRPGSPGDKAGRAHAQLLTPTSPACPLCAAPLLGLRVFVPTAEGLAPLRTSGSGDSTCSRPARATAGDLVKGPQGILHPRAGRGLRGRGAILITLKARFSGTPFGGQGCPRRGQSWEDGHFQLADQEGWEAGGNRAGRPEVVGNGAGGDDFCLLGLLSQSTTA